MKPVFCAVLLAFALSGCREERVDNPRAVYIEQPEPKECTSGKMDCYCHVPQETHRFIMITCEEKPWPKERKK